MVLIVFTLVLGKFNARAFASNFDDEILKQAISYAKLRNVKTHLTLNTLLKKEELPEAVTVAQKAISYGIDAIIVQDLGLASLLHSYFPSTPLHASTQMTIHNLEGVRQLEKLGFSRIVLARELSLEEIEFIASSTSLEIEVFVHGALCISYSGQCLFSSMVGGRSGNRGTCAQPCRLPYELFEARSEKKPDKILGQGYLLSPRDLCSLEMLPSLIKAGVQSFKIEGRMKSPEYVATVTRIYRKYIDLASVKQEYKIDPIDKKELLQIFNRGDFSQGHLANQPNHNLVFPEKPNHYGIYLGNITKMKKEKGLVTFKAKDSIKIGDQVAFEKEEHRYTVSEISLHNKTIKEGLPNQELTIGRMKGNLHIGDRIYKSSSKDLMQKARESYMSSNEKRKIPLEAFITIKQGLPIKLTVKASQKSPLSYQGLSVTAVSSVPAPEEAKNHPITQERVIEQLSKTNNTPYEFTHIEVSLQENTFLPNRKVLNEVRREALLKLEKAFLATTISSPSSLTPKEPSFKSKKLEKKSKPTFSLLLNYLHPEEDYSLLSDISALYLPLRFFATNKYEKILSYLTVHFPCMIYLPTIIKPNYINLCLHTMKIALKQYPIKGVVISNISQYTLLTELTLPENFEIIANYTMNLFNPYSIETLRNLGTKIITLSPESNEKELTELIEASSLPTELIVYGRTPLMTSNYCLLGKSNKCYPTCQSLCQNHQNHYLKDRKGFTFPVIPDYMQTITTIYNSKITSISPTLFQADSYRIDILQESVQDILAVVQKLKEGKCLEGPSYTNGNLHRTI